MAGDGREEFRQACARLGPGPAVLRDYVKSAKHYGDEAAYIPELGDQAAAWAIAARFRGLGDDDFTGGGRRPPVRAARLSRGPYLVDGGICRLITPHPDTRAGQPPPDIDLTPFTPRSSGRLRCRSQPPIWPGEQTGCGGSSSSAMASQ